MGHLSNASAWQVRHVQCTNRFPLRILFTTLQRDNFLVTMTPIESHVSPKEFHKLFLYLAGSVKRLTDQPFRPLRQGLAWTLTAGQLLLTAPTSASQQLKWKRTISSTATIQVIVLSYQVLPFWQSSSLQQVSWSSSDPVWYRDTTLHLFAVAKVCDQIVKIFQEKKRFVFSREKVCILQKDT